jgi:hypothetical protein
MTTLNIVEASLALEKLSTVITLSQSEQPLACRFLRHAAQARLPRGFPGLNSCH